MKKIFFSFLVCVLAVSVQAQSKIYTYDDAKKDASITLPKFDLFNGAELRAVEYYEYLRNLNDEERWLLHNYRKPADAQNYENVFISFVVEPNGTLSNIQVQGWDEQTKTKTTKLLPSVKREVIRVIRAMHKWTPAMKNGKAIRFRYEFHFAVRDYEWEHRSNNGVLSSDLDDDQVYEIAEEWPEFPGGNEAKFKWLSENVRPHEEIGRCVVQFIIEKDGSISNPKIIKSATPKLDAEAIRLAKAMPKWKPGKRNGKPVRVKYTLPMSFK